uniref:Adenylate kinase active site lid domain-containing protein n=2 Tax=Odontella aurita TaxID=265563 RepID=A0A7S4JYH1_9STRA|mmetsp:Transcript_57283/g.170804  ORF Transcript_57283/g.170804 Transcript_57283/m.170804 type:complete len:246 (+) Transcript_57283:72-809(+)
MEANINAGTMESGEEHEMNPLILSDPPRRIIIMGGPASGKGTQCEWISSRYNLVHLSTGDILREAVAKDSSPGSIGSLCRRYMEGGELVPDDVIIHVLKERIMQPDCEERGYLLDGFPRTRAQALALIEMGIVPDTFIFIDVPDEILIERVVGRRLDPTDGKIYHMTFKPPPEDIKDRLITRSDDNEEKAWKRLKQFHENVASVMQCFEKIIVHVDGSSSPDNVAENIRGLLEKRQTGPSTSRLN